MRGLFLAVYTFALLWSSVAGAFDATRFATLDKDTWGCLERSLDADLLGDLATGQAPASTEAQAAAQAALESCTCESRPGRWDGVLFDALAHPGGARETADGLERAVEAGLGKIILAQNAGGVARDMAREFPDLVISKKVTVSALVPLSALGTPVEARAELDRSRDALIVITGRETGLTGPCGFLDPGWKALMTDEAEQILFASGRRGGASWQEYPDAVARLRRLLSQLPRDAADAISHANAERLHGIVTIGP